MNLATASRTQDKTNRRPPTISQHVRAAALVLFLAGMAMTSVAGQQLGGPVETERFRVGTFPVGMAFDGENIWITNLGSITGRPPLITKLRASDGALLGNFPVPNYTAGAAFDGTYIWVTDVDLDTVTRLRLDGTIEGTYPAGKVGPYRILFDGSNIWVAFESSNYISKLRASDAALLGTFEVAPDTAQNGSFGLEYDGANIWVANSFNDTVTKVRATDGVVLGTFAAGDAPFGIAFDGTNIWVASYLDSTLRKFDLDGVNLQSASLDSPPVDVVYDGAHLWVAALNNTVPEMRGSMIEVALNGRVLLTVRTGPEPQELLFDGSGIWCTNFGNRSVTRVIQPQ